MKAGSTGYRGRCVQGGAGTSTNMNVNEVWPTGPCRSSAGHWAITGRSTRWTTSTSTNRPTTPTPPRWVAAIGPAKAGAKVVFLQEAFQQKEKEFADVVKIGRTESRTPCS